MARTKASARRRSQAGRDPAHNPAPMNEAIAGDPPRKFTSLLDYAQATAETDTRCNEQLVRAFQEAVRAAGEEIRVIAFGSLIMLWLQSRFKHLSLPPKDRRARFEIRALALGSAFWRDGAALNPTTIHLFAALERVKALWQREWPDAEFSCYWADPWVHDADLVAVRRFGYITEAAGVLEQKVPQSTDFTLFFMPGSSVFVLRNVLRCQLEGADGHKNLRFAVVDRAEYNMGSDQPVFKWDEKLFNMHWQAGPDKDGLDMTSPLHHLTDYDQRSGRPPFSFFYPKNEQPAALDELMAAHDRKTSPDAADFEKDFSLRARLCGWRRERQQEQQTPRSSTKRRRTGMQHSPFLSPCF